MAGRWTDAATSARNNCVTAKAHQNQDAEQELDMSTDTLTTEAEITNTAQSRARRLHPMLRTVLVHIAPALTAVYGLRAAGASEYVALLAGTVVAGIPTVYGIIKHRRLDPFAGYLMLMFGLSLIVALVTTDPQLILAGQTAVNGTAALVFLISAALGKPLTEIAAASFMTGTNPDATTRASLHGLHRRITIMVGTVLIAEVAARLIIIFSLPFDVANGLVAVIGGVALPAIFVVVGLMVRRFTARMKATRQA